MDALGLGLGCFLFASSYLNDELGNLQTTRANPERMVKGIFVDALAPPQQDQDMTSSDICRVQGSLSQLFSGRLARSSFGRLARSFSQVLEAQQRLSSRCTCIAYR